MDLTRYQELQQAKAVTIDPIPVVEGDPTTRPGTYTITTNVYDQNTGQLTGTKTETILREQIQDQRDQLQAQLDNLDAFLADLPIQIDPIIFPGPVEQVV